MCTWRTILAAKSLSSPEEKRVCSPLEFFCYPCIIVVFGILDHWRCNRYVVRNTGNKQLTNIAQGPRRTRTVMFTGMLSCAFLFVEVMLTATALWVGHRQLTQGHPFSKTLPRMCDACNLYLHVQRGLDECPRYAVTCERLRWPCTISDILCHDPYTLNRILAFFTRHWHISSCTFHPFSNSFVNGWTYFNLCDLIRGQARIASEANASINTLK